eukprot:767538-Prorocentrum_minimum.AAC.1
MYPLYVLYTLIHGLKSVLRPVGRLDLTKLPLATPCTPESHLSGEFTSLSGEFTSLSGEFASLSGEFASLSGEFAAAGGAEGAGDANVARAVNQKQSQVEVGDANLKANAQSPQWRP